MTPPEIVSAGGVMMNETDPVYHPFCPLGEPGDRVTTGAAGPAASKLNARRSTSETCQPGIICAC